MYIVSTEPPHSRRVVECVFSEYTMVYPLSIVVLNNTAQGVVALMVYFSMSSSRSAAVPTAADHNSNHCTI